MYLSQCTINLLLMIKVTSEVIQCTHTTENDKISDISFKKIYTVYINEN